MKKWTMIQYTYGQGETKLLTNETIQGKLWKPENDKTKLGKKKANKPEPPRQFYLHHRHQERPLSSYPFLRFMGEIDLQTLLRD